jgi:hypothetical protein
MTAETVSKKMKYRVVFVLGAFIYLCFSPSHSLFNLKSET